VYWSSPGVQLPAAKVPLLHAPGGHSPGLLHSPDTSWPPSQGAFRLVSASPSRLVGADDSAPVSSPSNVSMPPSSRPGSASTSSRAGAPASGMEASSARGSAPSTHWRSTSTDPSGHVQKLSGGTRTLPPLHGPSEFRRHPEQARAIKATTLRACMTQIPTTNRGHALRVASRPHGRGEIAWPSQWGTTAAGWRP
jgi:hypothetical protein